MNTALQAMASFMHLAKGAAKEYSLQKSTRCLYNVGWDVIATQQYATDSYKAAHPILCTRHTYMEVSIDVGDLLICPNCMETWFIGA